MKYDSIHKKYRLGCGLYFELIYDHITHRGKWFCKSNIPAIDYKKLQASNKKEAIAEIIAILENGFELKKNHDKVDLKKVFKDTVAEFFSPENVAKRHRLRAEAIKQQKIDNQKRRNMKTSKFLITALVLAILVYATLQFDDFTYLGWGAVYFITGVLLTVLWNIKKAKN